MFSKLNIHERERSSAMGKILKGYLAILGAITLWQMAKKNEGPDQSGDILKIIMLIAVTMSGLTFLGLNEIAHITGNNTIRSVGGVLLIASPLPITITFIIITACGVIKIFPIVAGVTIALPLIIILEIFHPMLCIYIWEYWNGYTPHGSLLISLLCFTPLLYSITLSYISAEILGVR
jgi:hypothetical protein